jgi:hypothetical protein
MARLALRNAQRLGDGQSMGLTAPALITFLLSFVLMLAVMFVKFFGATIPGLTSDFTQFAGLLGAYIILALGCLFRSL